MEKPTSTAKVDRSGGGDAPAQQPRPQGPQRWSRRAGAACDRVEHPLSIGTGGQFPLIVPKTEKEFSNQRAFVRDLPRLLAAEKSVGPMVQVA